MKGQIEIPVVMKKEKRYDHLMDVAFSYVSENEDPDDDPVDVKIIALQKRATYLKHHPEEAAEAFGYSDSHEIED